MLQQFFAFFIVLIVSLIVLTVIMVFVPMYRFLARANAVIKLYPIFKELLKIDFSKKDKVQVSYNEFKLVFYNTDEASIEFEKLIQDALKCYDKLGWIAIIDDEFKTLKDELVRICSEVRTLRWKKHGI